MTTSVFSPSTHVAVDPDNAEPFSVIVTVALLSAAVAVTPFDVFVVVAVYAVTSASNVGVSVSEPIRNCDRLAFKGL